MAAWKNAFARRSIPEIALSLLVGLALGGLVVGYRYLPLPEDFQKITLVLPFAVLVVALFNDLEKLILFAMAISVPLNLDFSVIISPYGRTALNSANGRTIVALTGLRLSLILIVVVVGYVLWLAEPRVPGRKRVRFFPATTIPALGLILVSIASVYGAHDMQLSFFKVAQLVELFLVYFYLANHIRTKQDLQFFILVLIGALLFESILMTIQWFTGLNFSVAGITAEISMRDRRAAGTLGTADTAGGIITAQLGLVCAMIWLLPSRSQKAFAFLCLCAGCVAMITTGSRAAWGSFIVLMAVFLYFGWRRGWIPSRAVIWFILVAVVVGGIFFPTIYRRLTEDDNGSAASRLLMFRLAWNMITNSVYHFVLGVGANNFALVAPAYNTVVGGSMGYAIQNTSVHNVYLLTWAETGLVGLLCFLGFIVSPFLKVWKHVQSDDRFISLVSLGLGCAFASMTIQMLVDPFLARPKPIFVWLVIGLIAGLENLNPESKQVSTQSADEQSPRLSKRYSI